MMNSGPTKRPVTDKDFEAFLSLLSKDRQQAAEKYLLLREKLRSFFRWNAAESPEDLADQAIDRVLEQIANGSTIQSLPSYVFTIAQHLLRESRLKIRKLNLVINEIYSSTQTTQSGENRIEEEIANHQKDLCLKNCLGQLPPEEASLILRYYEHKGAEKITNRKNMASGFGIPLNALRIRACRIRIKLFTCMQECLQRNSFSKTSLSKRKYE